MDMNKGSGGVMHMLLTALAPHTAHGRGRFQWPTQAISSTGLLVATTAVS